MKNSDIALFTGGMMKRRYILLLVGILLILLVFLTLPVLAEDSEMSWATLTGLQGVSVVVEEVQIAEAILNGK